MVPAAWCWYGTGTECTINSTVAAPRYCIMVPRRHYPNCCSDKYTFDLMQPGVTTQALDLLAAKYIKELDAIPNPMQNRCLAYTPFAAAAHTIMCTGAWGVFHMQYGHLSIMQV